MIGLLGLNVQSHAEEVLRLGLAVAQTLVRAQLEETACTLERARNSPFATIRPAGEVSNCSIMLPYELVESRGVGKECMSLQPI